MHASRYLENQLVDHLFRSATFPKPAAIYVALLAGGVEIAGGGYARVAVPPGDQHWTATQGGTAGPSTGTTGTTTNAAAVQFPPSSADWGTVTDCALYDAATGGNQLAGGPLLAPRSILAGSSPVFRAGTFQIQVR